MCVERTKRNQENNLLGCCKKIEYGKMYCVVMLKRLKCLYGVRSKAHGKEQTNQNEEEATEREKKKKKKKRKTAQNTTGIRSFE